MGKTLKEIENIIEENKKLVNFVLNKKFPSRKYDDDLYQIGLIALWKAAKNFNEGDAKFSTYAITCIKNSIIMEIQKENAKKRKLEENIIPFSLDAKFETNEGQADLSDSIGKDFIPYDTLGIKEYKTKLSHRKRKVLQLLLEGYSIDEISKMLQIGRTTIYKDKQDIQKGVNHYVN